VIVDGEVAFVGGIDLTSLAGDRFDWAPHEVRGGLGWHDVSTRLRGPAVADVAEHFAARWKAITGDEVPSASPQPEAGSPKLQIVRTVPERVYDFLPQGDFRVLEAYMRALRSAQRFIYLENQFLWSPEIAHVLVDKLRNPPADDFRLVVVLPARPNDGADDTRGQLGVLADADDGNERFLAATLHTRTGDLTGPMYVHAKVGIVDDRWLTIGSANLNEHSLFNDSEMNVVTCDEALARGDAPSACGPSTSTATPTASRARSSTSSGARTRSTRPGACARCRACRGAPPRCAGRFSPRRGRLERDVPVLALRARLALGQQRVQRGDDLRARLVRDDHVVDVAALGRAVGVREARLVVVHQLLAALVGRRRGGDVAAVDDVDRALGPITATSEVGHAKLKSASRCLDAMTS
jgi:hypothetical protein